jgi:flavin-dependent dehydrogenase
VTAVPEADVVIVGGRVAGASTALLLARAGARVVVVERGRYGSDTLSTHGLMRAGILQLARWGVLQEIVAAGTPAITSTLFRYAGGETTEVGIRPGPGVPALYAPRRHLLDRLLVDAAAEAGAEVHHERTVVSLLEQDGRVCGVRVRDPGGAETDVEAAVTVGADGIRSTVAAHTRPRIRCQGRAAGAVLYRYYEGLDVAGYEWAYGEGAAAGLIPTNDGRTCVFAGASPQRLRTLRREGIERAFTALLGQACPELPERLTAGAPVERLHGWAGVPGYLRQCWGPGWALVGDAGYFKDPITSHGITDGLRDAELLAEAVLDSLAGEVTEAKALDRYQATRDRLSHRLFAVTEAIAGYAWDDRTIGRLLREVSGAMGDEVELLQGRRTPDARGAAAASRR